MPSNQITRVAKVISDRQESDGEGGAYRVVRAIVESVEVASVIEERKVWRIEVSKPGLTTSHGIEVGTPVTAILRLREVESDIVEGALYVWSPELCGRSFRLNHDPVSDKGEVLDTRNLNSLPKNVSVAAILVTGCKK
jgi:hypothetical protein